MKTFSRIKEFFVHNWVLIIAIPLLTASIWIPRVAALDQYVTPDERFWVKRSANFFVAIRQQNYQEIYQRDHPGVTTMWAGAGAYSNLFSNIENFDIDKFSKDPGLVFKELGLRSIDVLESARQNMVLVNTALLIFAFILLKEIIGFFPAVLGIALISFNPFHIAHNRFLHLDGLLSNLMLVSIIAFVAYTNLDRNWRYLIISGIFAGLSWLTKSSGLFLIPFISLLVAIRFFGQLKGDAHPKPLLAGVKTVLIVIGWALTGILVFFVIFPAMWVDPVGVIMKIMEGAFSKTVGGHGSAVFFDGDAILDGKIGLEYYYFYPLSYLWRSTPASLIGLLLLIILLIRNNPNLSNSKTRNLITTLALFSVLYIFFMSISLKKWDRYILPIFPALDILAGIGWFAFASSLIKKQTRTLKKYSVIALVIGVIAVQLIGTVKTYPYYLNYYNPLMGGPKKAVEVMQIGWGEGLDQAAHYLNRIAETNEIVVKSWYEAGPFSYFYNGSVDIIPNSWEKLLSADYAVIYIHQWQRQFPKTILENLAQYEPEYSVWISGLEYVRIYNLNTIRELNFQ